jgi:prepilin-type N-terminal cleavage/methylation domain-containing protein/prepilin-type processing-associated H-X9-DG protein
MKAGEELGSAIRQYAARQAGYLTASQAREAGLSSAQQAALASIDSWERVERGIYRLPGHGDDLQSRCVRWSLWSCDRKGRAQAVISHASALCLHGLLADDGCAPVDLTVEPRVFQKSASAECRLHKRYLLKEQWEWQGTLRVTTVLQSLLDLSELPQEEQRVERIIAKALQRNQVTPGELRGAGLPVPEGRAGEAEHRLPPMRRERYGLRSRAGFTLVELLVVIAILSILSAMLLPTLGRALSAARDLKCSSQMRQLWLASSQYSDDYNDWLIFGYSAWHHTFNMLAGKVGPLDYGFTYPDSFMCPSEPVGFGDYHVGLYSYTHYGVNTWLTGDYSPIAVKADYIKRRSAVHTPSVAILFADNKMKTTYALGYVDFINFTRHGGGMYANIAYLDGTVTRRGYADFSSGGSTDMKKGF